MRMPKRRGLSFTEAGLAGITVGDRRRPCRPASLQGSAAMDPENEITTKPRKRTSRIAIALAIGAPLLVALTCFIVLAVLPAPEGPRLKDPLRSFLTGVGVLGVATPLCVAGLLLKRRFAASPYYEGHFIATVLSVFGLACLAAGLACVILGVYDLVMRFLDAGS